MALAEDLLLVAISPRTGRVRVVERMNIAVRSAELFDLALADRITVDADRIVVTDPTPIEHECLNQALAALRDTHRAPTPADWLRQRLPGPGMIRRYLTLLEGQSTIRVEQGGSGSDVSTRIVLTDEPRRALALARIDRVVRGDRDATAEDDALAAIVHACGLDRHLYRGPRAWRARLRLARLARRAGDAGSAGHSAIEKSTRTAIAAADAQFAAEASQSLADGMAKLTREMSNLMRRAYRIEHMNQGSGHGSSGSGHHSGGHGGGHGGDGGGGHGGGH